MSQTPKGSYVRDLAINVIKCRIRKELDDKISAWKSGRAIVNVYDVTRCGCRYRLSIDDPRPTVDNASREDVLRRYIIGYGVMNILSKAHRDSGAEIEKSLRYTLTVDEREVELVGIYDIFLPKEKEIVLIRHVKELRDGKPKKHHVEQAIVLQWLAHKNGISARPRILYYIGFGRGFREFTIDTNIVRSKTLIKEFEERLIARLGLVLSGGGPFDSWECGVCPYESHCTRKSNKVTTSSIVFEGEWIWYEDALLTRTMNSIRMLIERDIEFAGLAKDGVDADPSGVLRVSVTRLVGCPIKFWLSMAVPYASILSKLSGRVLRGDIVHSGIAYIVSKFNEVKQCCTNVDTVCRHVIGVEVEKRLSKHFDAHGYNVEVSGRADIVLTYEDGGSKNLVFELKTVDEDHPKTDEDRPKTKPHHEEQLKVYLNMLEGSRGRLVYITEVKARAEGDKTRRVLKFDEVEVNEPASDDHIKNRIKNIVRAREGLIDFDEIAKECGGLCRVCEFRDLCIMWCLLAKHRTVNKQ